jgi:hypothetical protein
VKGCGIPGALRGNGLCEDFDYSAAAMEEDVHSVQLATSAAMMHHGIAAQRRLQLVVHQDGHDELRIKTGTA